MRVGTLSITVNDMVPVILIGSYGLESIDSGKRFVQLGYLLVKGNIVPIDRKMRETMKDLHSSQECICANA